MHVPKIVFSAFILMAVSLVMPSQASASSFGNLIGNQNNLNIGNLLKVHSGCHYRRHSCYYDHGIDEAAYNRCLRDYGCAVRRYPRRYRRRWRRPSYSHSHRHTHRYRRRYSCSYWKRRCSRYFYREDYLGCLRYHGCYKPRRRYYRY